MSNLPLAYVCGPFTAKTPHGIAQNIRTAAELRDALVSKGYAVICPHTMYGLECVGKEPDEVYMAICLELVRRCDLVAVTSMGALNTSDGSAKEVALTLSLRIPVYRWGTDVIPTAEAFTANRPDHLGLFHDKIHRDAGKAKPAKVAKGSTK